MKKTVLLMTIAAILAIICPAATMAAPAQTIRVISYPVDVVDAKTGTVTVQWDDGAGGPANAVLLYGTTSMSYPNTLPVGALGTVSFIPESIGMTGGVYYFRLSNVAGIPDCWSNEYRLFIGKNSGLQVSGITLSPNPFSPDLGGLSIGYLPDSDNNTTVKITIKAYTMDGKLIRTIANGEMKTGGTTAVSAWDGKTDMGYFSKNGRYIIQIEAHDSTGTKQYLNTVVMVK
jgi:hypothetical protein